MPKRKQPAVKATTRKSGRRPGPAQSRHNNSAAAPPAAKEETWEKVLTHNAEWNKAVIPDLKAYAVEGKARIAEWGVASDRQDAANELLWGLTEARELFRTYPGEISGQKPLRRFRRAKAAADKKYERVNAKVGEFVEQISGRVKKAVQALIISKNDLRECDRLQELAKEYPSTVLFTEANPCAAIRETSQQLLATLQELSLAIGDRYDSLACAAEEELHEERRTTK